MIIFIINPKADHFNPGTENAELYQRNVKKALNLWRPHLVSISTGQFGGLMFAVFSLLFWGV